MNNPNQPNNPERSGKAIGGGFAEGGTMIIDLGQRAPVDRKRVDATLGATVTEVMVKQVNTLAPWGIISVETQNSKYKFQVIDHYGEDKPIQGTALLVVSSTSDIMTEGQVLYLAPNAVIAQNSPMIFLGDTPEAGNRTSALKKIEIIEPPRLPVYNHDNLPSMEA